MPDPLSPTINTNSPLLICKFTLFNAGTPAVYDLLSPESYFQQEEQEISEINQRIKSIENSQEYKNSLSHVKDAKDSAQKILSDFRARMQESKALKKEDILRILENILYEFPLTEIEFYMPKWVEMLPMDNRIKKDCILLIDEV